MADMVQLTIQPRATSGSMAAKKLRRQGLVPAVVYGHKETTVSIAVNHDDFEKALRHGARLLNLQSNGKGEQVLIQDVQWDHLGKDVLHVDFRRVSSDERVVVSVPVHLRGVAPGIAAGGVLDQPMHVIDVECLVTSVPESVRVNVAELQMGQAIHIRELKLPEGIVAKGDPDAIVVQVAAPKAEAEPVLGGEAAEPEVIGRQKAAEEGEEEKK